MERLKPLFMYATYAFSNIYYMYKSLTYFENKNHSINIKFIFSKSLLYLKSVCLIIYPKDYSSILNDKRIKYYVQNMKKNISTYNEHLYAVLRSRPFLTVPGFTISAAPAPVPSPSPAPAPALGKIVVIKLTF